MGMSVGGGDDEIKSEPNVVPMIDIMLVLLIIFMIVTPIISAGFQAKMPQARNIEGAEEEDGDVVLGIDNQGKYFLDAGDGEIRPVTPLGSMEGQDERLSDLLTQVYENRSNKIMYFRADQQLDFAYVEDAMDIARKAGVRVLAAVTEEARTLIQGSQ